MVNEYNQGAITLMVYMKVQPYTKHIAIKYHHLQIFVAKDDVVIEDIDTRQVIAHVFMKTLHPKLSRYLRHNDNS